MAGAYGVGAWGEGVVEVCGGVVGMIRKIVLVCKCIFGQTSLYKLGYMVGMGVWEGFRNGGWGNKRSNIG